ncbi:hypothetical protein KAFR_0B04990 [Kazachstania africana CBS 2517]|uniref:Peptidase S26 domain-containing protein n=1 Tax=Kazachstania africana (strain ATCC 22294 / BCRC 22015 / CBS 2517 / CECT 1963 / NBRC 1671 / NRRL Y-8276) TaxID=1071382 RepID=H2AQZ5_KAZAF|nr:hypothetical protein KAFR_0B04990 [Kazachstania africana CBS 2517]CCF56795.1 hypothetical protein KAFR_0B04990 [Kazachstania africana CBS 2517]
MSLKLARSTFTTGLKCFCLLHEIHRNVYEFTETAGESMIPTLSPQNDYVHVYKNLPHILKNLKIGDCVVLMKPNDSDSRVCKRITGMPDDIILVDPSNENNPNATNEYIRVPKGHVWVTGDNLSMSLDSRSYNVVSMGLIVGKVIAANNLNDKKRWLGFRFIENNYLKEEN